MSTEAFDVRSAVASLCRRHPALDNELRPFLEQNAARLLPALVGVLKTALLQPSMTLAVGSCFRPMHLPLVDSVVEQALGHQSEAGASHAAVSVAHISLLELAPHLERSVEHYLSTAEPAFPQLLAGLPSLQAMSPSPDTISKVQATRALLRALQHLPSLRTLWGLHNAEPIQALIETKEPDVRWLAIECLALLAKLGDADKARLREVVLTPEDGVGCAARWRADCERYAVERAGFWMSAVSSAPCAGTAGVAPAQQLAEVPSGSGYVSLGGVPVPSRGAQRAPVDTRAFVRTPTAEQNLQACALVLCQRQPLLLEGPPGSGKTALVSELARTTGNMDYVTVHIDDQMDAKSMLGAYVCTAVPGEFVWRPGPLMQAVSEGRWLLIEDINLAPPDVLASLVSLLERRQLYLPQRAQSIAAHPGFQLIASVTSSPGGGQAGAYGSAQGVRDLLGGLWSVVAVQAPTAEEHLAILGRAFPQLSALLPAGMAALSLVKTAAGQSWDTTDGPWDTSVRAAMTAAGLRTGDTALHTGRHFSLRDAIKWARRMQRVHGSLLQRSHQAMDTDTHDSLDTTQMPLALREAAFFESADCYTAMIANREAHRRMLTAVAALWALPEDSLEQYLTLRKPSLVQTDSDLHVGRANLSRSAPDGESRPRKPAKAAIKQGKAFAATGHVMRSLEAVAVAAAQQEPMLLVGETGTGKTTLVQHLAEQVGTKLIALNLSQQTDSADLLGGFQPVDPSHALLPLLERFQDLVRKTWVKGNNEDFLTRTLKYAQRQKWPSLLKAFHTAVAKVNALQRELAASDTERAGKRKKGLTDALREEWARFSDSVIAAERAARMAEGGFAFAFREGALVKALRQGHWVLLDEINLAPSEALERLAGIMESANSSIALVERGDLEPIPRHPDFRIFAAMNPATDAGKRELPAALRNRFTEMYVSEPTALADLRAVVAEYLAGAAPNPPLDAVVDFYIAAKHEAEMTLVDGAGSKPAYNLRTLSRALQYARAALPQYGLQRALYDGCAMAFLTQLHPSSTPAMERLLQSHILAGTSLKAVLRPVNQPQGSAHVLFEHFWVEAGAQPLPEPTDSPQFVMTPSVRGHLRSLARAALVRRFPILLQGPTSTGKTSLVTYLAAQTGHRCVRINNHEQTDLQEYLGSYIADENGRLVFREGALVTAVRQGHWVVLDELNLAPSEVLEALNRLLDDNRELYVPELGEMVKPHPHFMLFATQNPAGAYGGRKALSRAFRSRFLELHVGDIPDAELANILQERCQLAPTYAAKLVSVMRELQRRRQATNVFAGKHGYITPRDLFKWAGRGAVGYQQLAESGYLLLAERLRSAPERAVVQDVLESTMRVKLDIAALYQSEGEAPVQRLAAALGGAPSPRIEASSLQVLSGIVWTPSMRRMYTLVDRCLRSLEPVLLVGETGTGKTTVCQMAALMRGQRLHILNCNQHTETSDFLGGFRPARDREGAVRTFMAAAKTLQTAHVFAQCAVEAPQFPHKLAPVELFEAYQGAALAVQELDKAIGEQPPQADIRGAVAEVHAALAAAKAAALVARAPFQWVDGPLVTAMRQGDIILIDELNLAEDAVLERMNSVLEPGRTLTLAEKGGAGAEEITAAPGFRLVATMNPGGDYGKRELSPALSNRFTTVWVPPLEDISELAALLNARLASDELRAEVSERLLRFWQFFRPRAGATAGAALSVRDLLSWAGFINSTAPRIGALPAYAHGAHLTLLDGIGLGAGIPAEVAQRLKQQCQAFLLSQLPEEAQPAALAAASHYPTHSHGDNEMHEADVPECIITDPQGAVPILPACPEGMWGIPPFFVERGPHEAAQQGAAFEFGAPTTSRNALRVLRALQLKRSVLLEGRPGVGKTALIAALARATGHRHVRINLSEQTDMMDLLGADLPVEGGLPAEFAWADGPLLAALKAGDWVLLDELNLAGQSVLEGLNALLDHRAEVYIPELAQTFACPPSFRIFAAQNPVQEGGGRRGLPKSFLNRFTRVHAEPLRSQDLAFIAGALHPSIPTSVQQRMIQYLERLHVAANVQRSFGSTGGPWEFNLRDLLRWCQLLERHVCSQASQSSREEHMYNNAAGHFAAMLFLQRMRTPADRAHVSQTFTDLWGISLPNLEEQSITVTPGSLTIGWASLVRSSEGVTPARLCLMKSQAAAMECLAQCMQQSWMCILLGPSGSGKTSLARTLAGLAGQELVELALNGGTDTSDLLGGFEQLEPGRRLQVLVSEVQQLLEAATRLLLVTPHASEGAPAGLELRIAAAARVGGALRSSQEALHNALNAPTLTSGPAQECLQQLKTALQEALGTLCKLPQQQTGAEQMAARVKDSLDRVSAMQASLHVSLDSSSAGRFEWMDGVLTKAIEAGQWVLLDNANLCSATVLDRLNPLLEPDGVLLLNEAGASSGQARILKAHPNFRLILAQDPRHGELSQAMRNRGIEIFMGGSSATEPGMRHTVAADLQALLSASGVPGNTLPEAMVAAHLACTEDAASHHRRSPTARELLQWARLARLLCEQGWEASQALATSWRQTYTRAEPTPAGQAAAQAAFQEHCSSISAETLHMQYDALALSLSRPASWPLPLAASDIAADSGLATWAASSAVMTHLLHQLAALEALLSDVPHHSQLAGFDAASLPAPWLHQRLQGTKDSISGAALVYSLGGAGACQAAVSQGALLTQIAAGCLLERTSLQSVDVGTFWLQNVSQRAEAAYREGSEAVVAAEQAQKRHSDFRMHPAFEQARVQWLSLQQGVEAAGQYSALLQYPLHPSSLQQLQRLELTGSWAGACAPMLRSCAAALAAVRQDAIQDAALVHAAKAAQPSIVQTSFLRHGNTARRLNERPEHLLHDHLYPLVEALTAFHAATLQAAIPWTPQMHREAMSFGEWRAALWWVLHGTHRSKPTAQQGYSSTFQEDVFVFTWLRLQKAIDRLLRMASEFGAELDGSTELQRLQGIGNQVNEALGLHTRLSKPLLWKLGGHPRLPPSQHLYDLACKLQQLCMAVSIPSPEDPAAISPVKQLLLSATEALANGQHADAAVGGVGVEGEQDGADACSVETAATVAANLAADVELRQALQEGLALFQLAVSQANARPGSLPALGRLGGPSYEGADPAAAAASIVDTLQREVTGRAVQVLEQKEDVRSALKRLAATSNKPGPDGCLPETMPAGVLLTPYLQSLQLAILPFQERQRQLDLRVLLVRVMEALLSPHAALSGMSALQENAASLLRGSGSTASSDPAGLADVQLLSWLLNAQDSWDMAVKQLPMLMHNLWYTWHQSVWSAGRVLPAGSATLSVMVHRILSGGRTPLAERAGKALQLRLSARHLSRWCTTEAPSGPYIQLAQGWAAVGALLLQIVTVHRSTIPEGHAQNALDGAVADALRMQSQHQPASDRSEEVAGSLEEVLALSNHAKLKELLRPLLLPCLRLILCNAAGVQLLAGAQGLGTASERGTMHKQALEQEALQGAAWAMLGTLRLHLVSMPAGADPAAKHAHKRSHLHDLVSRTDADLTVRRMCQHVPLGPSEASTIAELEQKKEDLSQQVEALSAKVVLRPEPSQFGALQHEVAHFLGSLGSINRILALHAAIQSGDRSAFQQADSWVASASVWAARLLAAFPLYRDLLQPVALAVHEMRAGLATLLCAQKGLQTAAQDEQMGLVVAQLGPGSLGLHPQGGGILCSSRTMSLVSATAASDTRTKSSTASEVAAYTARLQLLQAALQQSARAVVFSSSTAAEGDGPSNRGALEGFGSVLAALLSAWEEVKAAEEQRAQQEAELFKNKTQTSTFQTEEEEEEADYKHRFPDYHASFADILEASGDGMEMEESFSGPHEAQQQHRATQAEASSALSKQLMQGQLLDDIVRQHARVFRHLAGEQAQQEDFRATFAASYALSMRLQHMHVQAGGSLPASLDAALAQSHLLALCLEEQRLVQAPPASSSEFAGSPDLIDMEKPCMPEVGLLDEPLQAMQARLQQLLADWPENPILTQLLVLCQRLTGMAAEAPLAEVLTGLELLLARSQLWQESAAQHVSLARQLERLAALALRWRRLQLHAWRHTIHKLKARHAAEAKKSWFHLYRLLIPSQELEQDRDRAQSLAAAVEQFMQSSPVGEYLSRLDLVWNFRCQALHGGSDAQALAAVMQNLHTYYKQFQFLVQEDLQKGLAPIEKHLKDFVELAKWEDRGYHAMKSATEKAQRQLHKMQRQAAAVLRQPAAAVLAAAAKAMGLGDLAAPEQLPGAVQKKGRAKAAPTLQSVVGDASSAWLAFCKGVSGEPAVGSNAGESQHPPYHERIPQLASRMGTVLAPAVVAPDASEGAQLLDDLAGEAAQRALELRGLTEKGVRARKKKALIDFMRALDQLGMSAKRSAVPAAERSVHAWFSQASPGVVVRDMLEEASGDIETDCLPGPARASSLAQWQKADAYYFCNIARVKRIWQASKAPNKDLSAREIAAAERFSEHLLFLQRQQRAFLAGLGHTHSRLIALANLVSSFADADSTPDQDLHRPWLEVFQARLDSLTVTFESTWHILDAAAATESAADRCRSLQGARDHIGRAQQRIAGLRAGLKQASVGVSVPGGGIFVTPALSGTLFKTHKGLESIGLDMQAADTEHSFSSKAPTWAFTLAIARTAIEEGRDFVKRQDAAHRPASLGGSVAAQSEWEAALERAVTSVLLWAQSASKAPGISADDTQHKTVQHAMEAVKRHAALPNLTPALDSAAALLKGIPGQPGQDARQAAAVAPLLRVAAGALHHLAAQYLPLHKATAKLSYVASSLFVGLLEEGFCTAEDSAEEAVGGEAGTFKEAEGTGMGEGEGKKDVSDQIQDEDQLLGAQQKDQPPPESKEDKEQPQKEEEEEAKGVEMEGDFDGDLFDLPSDAENDDEEGEQDEDEEQRLDQEMGDVGEEGQVVDERMWGDDDKPEPDQKPGEEQRGKDAPAEASGKRELEYRAGEQDTGDDTKEERRGAEEEKAGRQTPEGEAAQPDSAEQPGPEEEEGPVNEQAGEAGQQQSFTTPEAPEQELELPEDMTLDDDRKANADEAGQEAIDAPEAEGDAPETFPEPRDAGADDGGGAEQADQDADTAEPPDAQDGLEDMTAEQGTDAQLQELQLDEAEGDEGASGAEGEEDEAAEPAAKHGWNEDEARKDALPEAGPQGLASQSAAAQAAAQELASAAEGKGEEEAEAAGQEQGDQAQEIAAPGTPPPQARMSRFGAAQASRQGTGQSSAAQHGDQPPSRPNDHMQEANPYRSLGDALQQWQRRLSAKADAGKSSEEEQAGAGALEEPATDDVDAAGAQYEFVAEGDARQAGDAQALAPATEEQAAEAAAPETGGEGAMEDEAMAEDAWGEEPLAEEETPPAEEQVLKGSRQQTTAGGKQAGIMPEEPDEDEAMPEAEAEDAEAAEAAEQEREQAPGSYVASLLQQASLEDNPDDQEQELRALTPEVAARLRSQMEDLLKRADEARAVSASNEEAMRYGREMWARCEALTAGLAGELTEQLRLILEPTKATRLAGEYRSGKRLAMRKVIAYIASHFRKDKIWLRRTRPDQRTYQVVLAVDDSRSMQENGCGVFALEAVTLLTRALTRLEVGQVGVLRFGGTDHVRPLHDLDTPFSDAAGPSVLSNLRFDQDNTLADRPMVELLTMLMHMLDMARHSAQRGGGTPALHQLVLILADGRFHEKESLRRVVEEASSRPGVLLAFIILDNPAASVLDMQAVSFAGGQPSFSKYLDSFPFPFYIILRDLAALPSTLASLLRQWFELTAAGALS